MTTTNRHPNLSVPAAASDLAGDLAVPPHDVAADVASRPVPASVYRFRHRPPEVPVRRVSPSPQPARPEPWTVRFRVAHRWFPAARLWVAEIVGLDASFLFDRRFGAGRVFSGATDDGATDVVVRLARREGLFEIGYLDRTGAPIRRYCYVGGGIRVDLDDDAAFDVASLLESGRSLAA